MDGASTVRLLGVDRSGTEYTCIQNNGIFDGPVDQAAVSDIVAWHANTVRVPLNEDCWLAINGAPAKYSGSAYQSAIAQFVSLLRQNGLYVVLDLHWNAGGGNTAWSQQQMADADHAPAFWTSVADTFKSDLGVVFDLYNEPHDISWGCWKDGGCQVSGWNVAGMQQLLDAVRATGAKNVVMAGGLGYAGDLSQWLANEPNDPTGNLTASFHNYNFIGCANTTLLEFHDPARRRAGPRHHRRARRERLRPRVHRRVHELGGRRGGLLPRLVVERRLQLQQRPRPRLRLDGYADRLRPGAQDPPRRREPLTPPCAPARFLLPAALALAAAGCDSGQRTAGVSSAGGAGGAGPAAGSGDATAAPSAAASSGSGGGPGMPEPGDVVVDLGDVRQTIDGFGAADVWMGALTPAQADLFFSPTAGIGLSILRQGIDATGESLSDYGNAKMAAARGAVVWAAPWSPPAASKDNGDVNNGGHLLPADYDAWASTLAAFAGKLQANAGVPLYGVSAQNEPDFTASYPSCVYTADEMVAFVKVLGPKLHALSPPVKLLAAEPDLWADLWGQQNAYGAAILADPAAAASVDVLAAHQYGGGAVTGPPRGGHEGDLGDRGLRDHGAGPGRPQLGHRQRDRRGRLDPRRDRHGRGERLALLVADLAERRQRGPAAAGRRDDEAALHGRQLQQARPPGLPPHRHLRPGARGRPAHRVCGRGGRARRGRRHQRQRRRYAALGLRLGPDLAGAGDALGHVGGRRLGAEGGHRPERRTLLGHPRGAERHDLRRRA